MTTHFQTSRRNFCSSNLDIPPSKRQQMALVIMSMVGLSILLACQVMSKV